MAHLQSVLRLTELTSILHLQKFLKDSKSSNYLSVVIDDNQVPLLRSLPNKYKPTESCTNDTSTASALKNIVHNGNGLQWPKELRHAYKSALLQLGECTVEPVLRAIEPLANAELLRQQQRSTYASVWEDQPEEQIVAMKMHRFQIIRRVLARLPAGFDLMVDEKQIDTALHVAVTSLTSPHQIQLFAEALDFAATHSVTTEQQDDLFTVLQEYARQTGTAGEQAHDAEPNAEMIVLTIQSISLRHRRASLSAMGHSPKKNSQYFSHQPSAGVVRQLFKDEREGKEDNALRYPSPVRKPSQPRTPVVEKPVNSVPTSPMTTPQTRSRRTRHGDSDSTHSDSRHSHGKSRHRQSTQHSDNHVSSTRKNRSGDKSSVKSTSTSVVHSNQGGNVQGPRLLDLYKRAPSNLKAMLEKRQQIEMENFLAELGDIDLSADRVVLTENLRQAIANQELLGDDCIGLEKTIAILVKIENSSYYNSDEEKNLRVCLRIMLRLLHNEASMHQSRRKNASDSHGRAYHHESSGADSLTGLEKTLPRTPSHIPNSSTEHTPPSGQKKRKESDS